MNQYYDVGGTKKHYQKDPQIWQELHILLSYYVITYSSISKNTGDRYEIKDTNRHIGEKNQYKR